MKSLVLYTFVFLVFTNTIYTQNNQPSHSSGQIPNPAGDSTTNERDIVDVCHALIKSKNHPHLYKPKSKNEQIRFSATPAVGYSLQTGFAALAAGNAVFYLDSSPDAKTSTVLFSIAYTQYQQLISPLSSTIWSKNKKYNFISDFRYMNYPTQTFGLGARTKSQNGYYINFSYLRLHQSVLHSIYKNLFAGLGIYYDYLWNEREMNPPEGAKTSFERYGIHSSETASGICLQTLFDNRKNQINSKQGIYGNLRYRINKKKLGSSANWQSVIIDLRKYFTLSQRTQNVLALWSYNWYIIAGKPPYILLPSTGWDDFFNTGRGYIQGRYKSRDMTYLEAEYRFRILKSGLLGGVVFANAQHISRTITTSRPDLIPGYGFGLRIKMNKHSETNLCLDYGFGTDGSSGLFVNLSEVF